LGTPAITSRGMKEEHMPQIANLIDKALMNHENEEILMGIKVEVNNWMKQFPLYS